MNPDEPASPVQLSHNYLAATEVAADARGGGTRLDAVLRDLLSRTIDTLEGYGGMEGGIDPQVAPLIADWVAVHERHAGELEKLMLDRGVLGREGGIMGVVNRLVTTARASLTGIDHAALTPLLRGEQTLIDRYADAIATSGDPGEAGLLERHQTELLRLANRTQDAIDGH